MRRSTTLPLALTLVLVALLGFTPDLLAKQGGEPIPDPAPSFEDVLVTCDGQACENIETPQRTYDVEFGPGAYVPELGPEATIDEVIVVRVLKGTLAFRVQTGDVIVDPQGTGGDAASNEIMILTTDVEVQFGKTPSEADPQPVYSANGFMSNADCSRGPLQNLCLLNPTQFADQKTFVQLEPDDIVYLPAGSTCFICNITGVTPGDSNSGSNANVLVWAPGSDFSWSEFSQRDNPSLTQTTPTTQGTGGVLGWMFNPGSRCN